MSTTKVCSCGVWIEEEQNACPFCERYTAKILGDGRKPEYHWQPTLFPGLFGECVDQQGTLFDLGSSDKPRVVACHPDQMDLPLEADDASND